MSVPSAENSGIHSGTSLFRGALWSSFGLIVPLLVAMATIPRILHALGDERFGLLMLLWLLAGYFTILDLGLGRALILVFSRLTLGVDKEKISSVFWAGSAILAMLGLAIAVIVHYFAPSICGLLGVSENLETEAIGAIRISGWTMPALLTMHVTMGIPTAFQRLRGLNLLRIPAGIASHLVPLVMVGWTTDLRHLMLANLGLRIVLFFVHLLYALHVQPISWKPAGFQTSARMLLSIGSWMMLTNILAPILMNSDRLLISNRLGAGAIASYSPAMDMANKILLLVGGSFSVLFPALGFHFLTSRSRAAGVYTGTLRSMAWWITPFMILGSGFSRPFMMLWLGPAHGESASIFLSVFLIGIHWSLAGQICFAAVQAAGDARRASFVHAIELPFHILLLLFGLWKGGLVGVACAWAFRHIVDTLALHFIARSHGLKTDSEWTFLGPLTIGTMALLPIPILNDSTNIAGSVYGTISFLAWIIIAWLHPAGRNSIPGFLHRYLPLLPK